MKKLFYTFMAIVSLSILSVKMEAEVIKVTEIVHDYNKADLQEAYEASGDDKSATVAGRIFTHYSNGTSSSEEVTFTKEEGGISITKDISGVLTTSNVWMLLATFLVFIMHLGFSALEVSLTRAKNAVNILFKNAAVIAIGLLTYAMVGFNLHYPGGDFSWLGFAGFGLDPGAGYISSTYAGAGYTYWTDFLFQGMFAATAMTIVSGAVAERIKLSAFLLFAVIFVAFCYPIIGSWHWGGGYLSSEWGFYDFAGSTVVHSVGGWAALACVMILGAREGKYINGMIKPIKGHNLPLASVGVFLLWFGWFGFNGGSVLSADAEGISLVCVTTSLAASAGIIGAMAVSWIFQKHPDLSMVLNGCLAGLVGITAGADQVSVCSAIIIGLIAGILVVGSVIFFDRKLKIDDPVGATSVHLVCGIWGTLAVAIFSENPDITFVGQLVGVIVVGIASFVSAYVLFYIIKLVIGVRVTKKEELTGLDISEHGMEAYDGFQIFNNQ